MKLSLPALKIVSTISLIIVFFVSGAITYVVLSLSSIFVDKPSSETSFEHEFTNSIELAPPQVDSTISVLMLGYGGAGHDGGALSDVLMLARIDYENKNVSLISIPRDLWVGLPVRSDKSESFKINTAHAIGLDDVRYGLKEPLYRGETGGGEMAKYAASKVTGIPIDYFISVDFEGFKKVVDILDEIEVDVPVSFTDNFYPVKGLENETCGFTSAEIDLFHRMYSGFELEKQFTCRYETLQFTKGKTKMDGDTALKFVRSRHSDTHGGDFARSQRQQALLNSVQDTLLTRQILSSPQRLKDVVDETSKIVRTDFPLESLDKIRDLIGDPSSYSISTINLTTDNVLMNSTSSGGAYILIPKDGDGKWDGVKNYILSNIR